MPQAYRPKILGVLNVSPESMVHESIAIGANQIKARATELVQAGADWIDLGGRSITPDAPLVDDAQEQDRLLGAMPILREAPRPVSIDTWSEATAGVALEAGADAINFTGGEIGPRTLDDIAARSATLFLTFMPYENAYVMRTAAPASVGIDAILEHLRPKVEAARRAGISEIIVDPNVGIIHPSTEDTRKIHQQLEVVWNLDSLRPLGCPILIYAARKPERLARIMMASAVVHARADYIRTHTPNMIRKLLHDAE